MCPLLRLNQLLLWNWTGRWQKKYGKSKAHRPNPIVQMGLFTDGDGIPLAFSLFPGNQNEQASLKPLEKKVIDEFGCEKFIFCSDAGLASESNRFLNHTQNRQFIVTQSIKIYRKRSCYRRNRRYLIFSGWRKDCPGGSIRWSLCCLYRFLWGHTRIHPEDQREQMADISLFPDHENWFFRRTHLCSARGPSPLSYGCSGSIFWFAEQSLN